MELGRRRLRSCFANTGPGGRGSPSDLIRKVCPQGLDAVRMKAEKSAGSKGECLVRIPEAWSREPKSPRWSAERRARFRNFEARAAVPTCTAAVDTHCVFRRSAPLREHAGR